EKTNNKKDGMKAFFKPGEKKGDDSFLDEKPKEDKKSPIKNQTQIQKDTNKSYSAIKCKKAERRSEEELKKLGLTVPKTESPQTKPLTIKKENVTAPPSNMTNIKKKPEPKGSIATMFGNTNKKTTVKSEIEETSSQNKTEKPKTQVFMSWFFIQYLS
ncbi:hypothetical protein LOTGIDRAFT_176113, partial [Lottia gigantea]